MKMLFAIWTMLLPTLVWAHPGHGESGLVAGIAHPFSGLDHILCMLAVGVWAARTNARGRWVIPLAFLGGMLAGGVLGLNGYLPSFIESAVSASVLASALLVALAVRLPLPAQVATAAFFALWHGISHGAELPAMTVPLSYASGFIAATAFLLAAGLMLGHQLQKNDKDRWLGAGMVALAASLFWA